MRGIFWVHVTNHVFEWTIFEHWKLLIISYLLNKQAVAFNSFFKSHLIFLIVVYKQGENQMHPKCAASFGHVFPTRIYSSGQGTW